MRLFHYPAINNRPSRWRGQELEGESHRRGPESTKPEPRPQWEKSGIISYYERRGIILSPQSLCPVPRARSNKSQGNHDKSIFPVHTQSQFGYLSLCSVRLKKLHIKWLVLVEPSCYVFFIIFKMNIFIGESISWEAFRDLLRSLWNFLDGFGGLSWRNINRAGNLKRLEMPIPSATSSDHSNHECITLREKKLFVEQRIENIESGRVEPFDSQWGLEVGFLRTSRFQNMQIQIQIDRLRNVKI